MGRTNDDLYLNIKLSGLDAESYRALKGALGLKHHSEVIRYLVRQELRRIGEAIEGVED